MNTVCSTINEQHDKHISTLSKRMRFHDVVWKYPYIYIYIHVYYIYIYTYIIHIISIFVTISIIVL